MSEVLVVAPEPLGDGDGLRVSRVIATWAIGRLEAEARPLVLLLDGDARRGRLSAAIPPSARGLAFFCHGMDRALTISECEEPLLDLNNLGIANGRWIYAFACRSGKALAYDALRAGAACYGGYEASLNVEWSPDGLPRPALEVLQPFLTETISSLAAGRYELGTLQGRLNDLRITAVQALYDHPEWLDGMEAIGQMGLFVLLGQLVNALVVLTTPAPG